MLGNLPPETGRELQPGVLAASCEAKPPSSALPRTRRGGSARGGLGQNEPLEQLQLGSASCRRQLERIPLLVPRERFQDCPAIFPPLKTFHRAKRKVTQSPPGKCLTAADRVWTWSQRPGSAH